MFCVPTPPVIANYTGVLGADTPRISPLWREVAVMEFVI